MWLRSGGTGADIRRDARIERVLSVEALPAWPEVGADPSAMNRHLRRIWTRVQIDDAIAPTAMWRDSRSRYDPALQVLQEAELRDPEAAGLVTFPFERRVDAVSGYAGG
jgi:hypothetical protein